MVESNWPNLNGVDELSDGVDCPNEIAGTTEGGFKETVLSVPAS